MQPYDDDLDVLEEMLAAVEEKPAFRTARENYNVALRNLRASAPAGFDAALLDLDSLVGALVTEAQIAAAGTAGGSRERGARRRYTALVKKIGLKLPAARQWDLLEIDDLVSVLVRAGREAAAQEAGHV